MNNKELTELKKEFEALMDKFNYPEYGISLEEDREEIFDFFLPHLKSNDEIKREVRRCKLCNKETDCVYNINLKATSICEGCGRAIAKQELDDMFQAQKENNE